MAVSRNDDPKWIGKDNIGLEELEGIPLILMQRQAGIHCHDMVIDEMKNKGVNADVFCESDNISAILSLVEAELGIAILPVSTLSVRPSGDFHGNGQLPIANCNRPPPFCGKKTSHCRQPQNCFWKCSESLTTRFWQKLK